MCVYICPAAYISILDAFSTAGGLSQPLRTYGSGPIPFSPPLECEKKRCKSELWSLNIYKIRRANPKLEGQLYQIMAMSIYLMIFRVYDGSSSWGRPIDYVYVLIMRSSLIIWEIMVWWWQTIPNWALLLGHQMISEWMVTDGYWDCCSWLHWFYSRWAP